MKRCKILPTAIFLAISFWCYISLSSIDVLSEDNEPDSKLAKRSEELVEIEVREEKPETSPNPKITNEQNVFDEKGKEKLITDSLIDTKLRTSIERGNGKDRTEIYQTP